MPSQESACKSVPFSSTNRGSWTNNAHYFFYIDGTEPNVRLFLEHTQYSVHGGAQGVIRITVQINERRTTAVSLTRSHSLAQP